MSVCFSAYPTGGLSQLQVSRFASLHPSVRAALLKNLLEVTCTYHKSILGYAAAAALDDDPD